MNPLKPSPSHGAAVESAESRRRSQRVMLRVGVILHCDEKGKSTAIDAHTLVVNAHGAMICSPKNMPGDTWIEVEHKSTQERRKARVTRQPQSSPEGFLVPVEFEATDGDFWHISFPPSDWKPLES